MRYLILIALIACAPVEGASAPDESQAARDVVVIAEYVPWPSDCEVSYDEWNTCNCHEMCNEWSDRCAEFYTVNSCDTAQYYCDAAVAGDECVTEYYEGSGHG